MIALLNALPLNFSGEALFGKHCFVVREISEKELKEFLNENEVIECFIRHSTTIEYLNTLLGLNLKPSNAKKAWSNYDKAIIVVADNYRRDGKEVEEELKLKYFLVEYYDNLNLVGF